MSTYRERREARAERLREWADKREAKAEAADARSRALTAGIPFGQPILAGHHSQRRHQRTVNAARSAAEQSWEHSDKARAMRAKAANIEAAAAAAIYSDDVDAVERLRAKLAALEAERERVKAYNKSCRRGAPDVSLLDDAQRRELVSLAQLAAWQMKGGAFPSYVLSNLGGRITATRKRLAEFDSRPEAG